MSQPFDEAPEERAPAQEAPVEAPVEADLPDEPGEDVLDAGVGTPDAGEAPAETEAPEGRTAEGQAAAEAES
ncbi:MAG: DUF349 domain-containing protein, partial [Actinomycetota bacterium]|nr:DUF349 domain-containing protein [Actinomycetota bacterium]